MKKHSSSLVLAIAVLFVAGCSSPYAPSPPTASGSSRSREGVGARPGLATKLGDERRDHSVSAHFYRKLDRTPDAVVSFHYNDERGAKAMADLLGGGRKRSGAASLAHGRLRASLVSGSWRELCLPSYEAGGKVIFIGTPDSSYAINLENTSANRVEAVVSVDGLDVRSGAVAGFERRGFVIEPHSGISVAGMTVNGKLRSFQFGSVADSQAAKSGSARNVGVIGIGLFEEDEAAARAAQKVENDLRGEAAAFPGS